MHYIGLDVHKKTISYCVKDAAGKIHSEGKIGSTRRELDAWIKTLPQPRVMAPAWNLVSMTSDERDFAEPNASKRLGRMECFLVSYAGSLFWLR
jgi:hypothetical protein